MTTNAAASLVNLLAFLTGIVLYVMVLWLVLSARPASNRLVVLTGFLGFAWNVGSLSGYGLLTFGFNQPAALLTAAAFGALCFLPAVVVHSALRLGETFTHPLKLLVVTLAYGMSTTATVMHFYSAVTSGITPSQKALMGVTVGYGALLAVLLVVTPRQEGRGRMLWVVALAVFAVSALHLGNHQGGQQDPWWLELVGHHASLPLALLILYQDFRFALADIFLKRALAFMLLAGLTFSVFVFGVAPLLTNDPLSERSSALLLGMWLATAIIYPQLRRSAEWFVDKIVLRRVDYTELASSLSQAIDRCETPGAILDEASRTIAPALNAESVEWSESRKTAVDLWIRPDRRSATLLVPTAEVPQYVMTIRDLSGGRRLLSGDIAMIERGALLVARRIDTVRSIQEQYRRDLHEQEMRKLAAEAELRALRAQVNPHFLFNALTTIGYLIQTAPDRALVTLMRLSGMLRRVLGSGAEFVTIGEELDLIEAYLDIERARFEDRLQVFIDVPGELRSLRIPALVIQPLVENAIKHGISECIAGGEVRICAQLQYARDTHSAAILVSVIDTGVGATLSVIEKRKGGGVGLSNVEQRLQRYGAGPDAVVLQSEPGLGTSVEIRIPVQSADLASLNAAASVESL